MRAVATFLVLPFTILLQQSLAADVEAESSDTKLATSETASGRVVMTAMMPATAPAGGLVPLRLEVQNVSQDEVQYFETDTVRGFKLEVVDQAGERVPYTRWGKSELASPPGFQRNTTPLIGAGKSIVVIENLSRLYDLTVEGDYEVRIRWHASDFVREKPEHLTMRSRDHVEAKLEFKLVADQPLVSRFMAQVLKAAGAGRDAEAGHPNEAKASPTDQEEVEVDEPAAVQAEDEAPGQESSPVLDLPAAPKD